MTSWSMCRSLPSAVTYECLAVPVNEQAPVDKLITIWSCKGADKPDDSDDVVSIRGKVASLELRSTD